MKKSMKTKLLSLSMCLCVCATTLLSDTTLSALAAEGDSGNRLSDALIADFSFDSEEAGFSGSGAKAVSNGVTLTDSTLGKAAYFDGSSYLSVTKDDGTSLLTGLTQATVSYVRTDVGQSGWTFFAAPNTNEQKWPNEHYVGVMDNKENNGEITVERYNNSGSRPGSLSVSAVSKDTQLITIVLDETTTYIYIDGTLTGTRENDYKLTDILGDSSILQIGKANWQTNGEFLKGSIEELSIYNAALTAEEISAIYSDYTERVSVAEAAAKEEKKAEEEAEKNTDYAAADSELLSIPDSDAVTGNITLPTTGKSGKTTITWTSSDTSVITDKATSNEGYADTPAGVVTRGDTDKTVKLTANLTDGTHTATKEIEVTVKAKVEMEETTDYLFAYFTSNTVEGEKIYFASSRDGLNYTELNDSEPVLSSTLGTTGLRDPFIMRSKEGDKFYLLATDLSIGGGTSWGSAQNAGSQAIMVWESTDLVNWSEQRMVTISEEIGAGCTWAPEAYYDDITGEYVVFWASKVASDNYSLQRVYYCKTRDFVTFTDPEVWIDRSTASTIDTTIVAGNDGYLYRISKNEGNATLSDGTTVTGATVYMERSTSLFGTWTKVNAPTLEAISGVEGPTSYKLNDDDASEDTWCVLLDHYSSNGYTPYLTTTLDVNDSETVVTLADSYNLPSSPRHGTVLPITASEYKNIMKKYGTVSVDKSEIPEYVLAGSTVSLPSTVKVTYDGETTEESVSWDVTADTFAKAGTVTVTGHLTNYEQDVTATINVIASDILYFIDSNVTGNGDLKKSSVYEGIKKVADLKNDVADQVYEEGSWGIMNDGSSYVGSYNSSTDDIYSNGYYAYGNKNCEYIIPLSNGTYSVTGYFNEWWSVTRKMDFKVTYTNDDGEEVTSDVNEFTISGSTPRLEETVNFTVENVTGTTEVHFVVSKAASSDPVISGLALYGTPEETEEVALETDVSYKVDLTETTKFNDTNGDGFGEFEGWGTSLCWWANRIGYSAKMVKDAATKFFSADGLNLNIGRYNVGGGDDVEPAKETTLTVNPDATVYDLTTEGKKPTYSGSSMSVSTVIFASCKYTEADGDFGFVKGASSQTFNYIGWINELGGTVGSGSNLNYTVSADAAGKYTFKFLLTLTGTNTRNIAIKVNNDKTYTASYTDNVQVAAASSSKLYVATISGVELKKGENTVVFGGYGDWAPDFIEMLVIPAGKELEASTETVTEEEDESADPFLHTEHITRSDSVVPGYCVDVTKMDLTNHTLSYYQENFARADETSGYAWNYDWTADNNQVNMLVAAAAASGEDFLAEAFSNSPPYFMTVSGCSSGNEDANTDNLREDCVTAFACYLADVIEHLNNEDNGITFQSATAMNEPYTNYWAAYSNKQEGCHFDIGESQSRIIVALNKELKAKGIDLVISASDETSIDTAITSYNALSDEAKEAVTRIDTHTYSGSQREELSTLASESGEDLWMSEIDGSGTMGADAGDMGAALWFANRIITDVDGLDCTAWIMWDAVDIHVDANNKFDADTIEATGYDSESGYWGIAIGDHNNEEIVLTKKYYAYGQFSRYIRPGMTIINSTGNSLSAYDPETGKIVVVVLNTSAKDKTAKIDLSAFGSISSSIQAIRTSGSLEDGENWADVTASAVTKVDTKSKNLYTTLIANSITTFVIGGSTLKSAEEEEKEKEEQELVTKDFADSLSDVSEYNITTDMVTGTAAWNNTSNTAELTVDGKTSTFFDGVTDGYVVIDLGKEIPIKALGYCPRTNYTDRMKEGMFYGSNDGENWTLLYTIPKTPTASTITTVFEGDFETQGSFRYIKYTCVEGGNCNVAELKVYTTPETNKTTYTSISGTNGAKMYDTNGNLIQAHGGQIQQLTVNGVTKYYWIGEDKTDDYRPCAGIHMYSSTDLLNWDDEGLVLKTMSSTEDFNTDYFKALYGGLAEDGSLTDYQQAVYDDLWNDADGTVIERPKMLYNSATGKYVIFFHADGKTPNSDSTSNYAKAKLGIAISDSVNGPYKLLGTYLLHQDTGYSTSWDTVNGHVRDMNVFQDDDGTAYVMYSSDGNTDMYIAKLNADYTGLQMSGTDEDGNPKGVYGTDYVVATTNSREAPAMFKHGGKYYLITSACSGWSPNAASYAVADSVLGTWTTVGNPCTDTGASTTYDTQSTCVVKLANGGYMYMGDRWNEQVLRDSRYVWLPIEFTSDGGIKIGNYTDWNLSVYDSIKPFEIKTSLPTEAISVAALKEKLPEKVTIQYEGETDSTELGVTWNLDTTDYAIGQVTVDGTLENGRTVSFNCNVINAQLIYFFDCAATQDGVSVTDGLFDTIAAKLGTQLKNTAMDQAYSEETKAGYTGTFGTDIGFKNAGSTVYEHGFWAYSGKTIDYSFDLEAGSYAVDLGFAEWWSTTRYMAITVSDGENTLATLDFTSPSSATALQESCEFTLEKASTVTVSVSKTTGSDPVLSFIALIDKSIVPAKEEEKKDDTPSEDTTKDDGTTSGDSSSSSDSSSTGTGTSTDSSSKTSGSGSSSSTASSSGSSASTSTGTTVDAGNITASTSTTTATASTSTTTKKSAAAKTKTETEEVEETEETVEIPEEETPQTAEEEVSSDTEEETNIDETPVAKDGGSEESEGTSFPIIPVAGVGIAIILIALASFIYLRKKNNA